jgi:predicted alpha/beta-fold hydrolase
MVLKWSTFKIISRDDPNLHPRWPPSADIVPIGSYVKTMSADGGHLGWRSRSQDIILKVDHLRTIHAMFALKPI